jgi:hypothetical protein
MSGELQFLIAVDAVVCLHMYNTNVYSLLLFHLCPSKAQLLEENKYGSFKHFITVQHV